MRKNKKVSIFTRPWPYANLSMEMYDNLDFILCVWIFLFVIWIPVLLKLAMFMCGMCRPTTPAEAKNEPYVVCVIEF